MFLVQIFNKITKTVDGQWFGSTVLIAALPFFVRFYNFANRAGDPGFLYIINEIDLASFALGLQITNINYLWDRLSDPKEKAKLPYVLLVLIVCAVFLSNTYNAELEKRTPDQMLYIKISAVVTAFISLLHSYTVCGKANQTTP